MRGDVEQRLEGGEGLIRADKQSWCNLCKGPEAGRGCHVPDSEKARVAGRGGLAGVGGSRKD